MKAIHSSSSGVWDTLLIAAAAALAVWCSQTPLAVADEADDNGRIVDLTPGNDADAPTAQDEAEQSPTYWLGIEGGPLDSDVLRTHLQLAGDVGVVVRGVAAKSPAEKAGLRQYDIIIGVGGQQVNGMETLQKVVADSDAKPIELKIIRLAKEMTISVTPEKMPKEVFQAAREAAENGGGFGGFQKNLNFNFQNLPDINGEVNAALKALEGGAGGMRVIGPGMILNGQRFDAGTLPNGVSVAVTRENDGPAKITVKQGDKTWTVDGNDKEAIEKLPQEVRPFVEQMLGGQNQPKFQWKIQNGQVGGGFGAPGQAWGRADLDGIRQRTEDANQRMLKQMQEMEKRLQDMQRRFEERFPADDANAAADPAKT